MGSGKFTTKLVGDDVMFCPMVVTIRKFSTPQELKDELNRTWRERNPTQPLSLSLSKIRSLKAESAKGASSIGLELSTVAYACIYLERLCLQRGTLQMRSRCVKQSHFFVTSLPSAVD